MIRKACFLYPRVFLAQFLLLVSIGISLKAQSPVGRWEFNEGSGTTASDSSRNGHTAFLFNGLGWSTGRVAGGVSANAASRQHVYISPVDLNGTKAVTVALWAKRTYSQAGGHVLFEASTNYNNSTAGFVFLPDDEICQGVQIAIRGDVGYTASCYNQPSSGAWHHLAVVLDKSQTGGNAITFLVDGMVQTPTRSLSASTNTNNFGREPIYLFSRGGTADFDSGMIADFRIYDKALTSQQIQKIYRVGGLVSLSVTPGGSSITAGSQQRFTATKSNRDGSDRNPTNSITWTSTLPSVAAPSTGITLDGTVHGVHDNGSAANTNASLSIGKPTTGDLITCEVTFDGHNQNALVSLSDNNNGSYVAAVPAHLNTTLVQWFGIYYKENVAGSPTTITLKTSQSNPWAALSCQAWSGVATSNSLDTGFLQSRDALSTPNPTTGVNKTPVGSGDVVIAGLGLYSSGTPTAGTNYALIDSASASQWWPEYWIQTAATATAGNFIRGSDNFTDMMAAFKPATVANSFIISASPGSLSVSQGNQGTSTVTTSVSGSFNNVITLSASGVPTGTTVSFGPNPIPAPGSGNSTMTITVGNSTPAGTYPMTVTGSGGGLQKAASFALTVASAGNFTLAAAPSSLSVAQGNLGTSTITTTVSGGFNSAITLSASGVPSGTTVSFSPNPIPAPGSGSSTMTITVGSNTPTGAYSITVTGNGGGLQKLATVILTVTAAPNFTIAASPASVNVVRGNQGTSTITTTVSGGFNSAITLSALGVPSGTTVSFGPNPLPTPGSGSSIMTITVGSNTPTGVYSITITGNGGTIQRSTTVNLSVAARVALSWTASTSSGISGYNAYRSTTSGGPYTKLNSNLISSTNYSDLLALSGYTYYYVTTAVDSQGSESIYSNEAIAAVP